MSLFCVVAGLLGHAAALEPMGVSDILGGVPSVNVHALSPLRCDHLYYSLTDGHGCSMSLSFFALVVY